MLSVIILFAIICGAIAVVFGYPVWKILGPVLILPLLVCTLSVASHQLGLLSPVQALGLAVVLFLMPPFAKGVVSGLTSIALHRSAWKKARLSSAKIERLPLPEPHTPEIRALGPGADHTESSSWDG